MSKLIAIVDDEEDILQLVSINLKKNGYITKEFLDGKSFLRSINAKKPDLVILDVMLPDIDGLEICKKLKSEDNFKNIPIIMLTAKSDEMDKVLGLELGADDYVVKPFSPRELVSRVKARLRGHEEIKVKDIKKIKVGNIVIDNEQFVVTVLGKKIDLTTTEFKILSILCSKIGNVFSRDKILENLWGEEKLVVDRTIDVHVTNLRKKLGASGDIIKNIRGIGYKVEL